MKIKPKQWHITLDLIDYGPQNPEESYLTQSDMKDLMNSIDLPVGVKCNGVKYVSYEVGE